MRNLFYSFILLLQFMAAGHVHADQPVILVLGDSLSAAFGIERQSGWVNLLQERLIKKGYPHQVVNASISGNTTRAGLSRLPTTLKQHKPAIVIIELGGNDGLQGLSLSEFRNNLDRMTQLVISANAKPLLCGVRIPPNLGLVYGSKFLGIYQEISEKHQVPLVTYILKGVSQNSHLMQQDGVHPTAAGQPIILDNVWEKLAPLLS